MRTAIKRRLLIGLATLAATLLIPGGASAVTVNLTADKSSVRIGQDVNFTLGVAASLGATSGGITQIADNIFGDIQGRGLCATIPSGADFTFTQPYRCVFTAEITGRPGTHIHTVTVGGTEAYCPPNNSPPCPGTQVTSTNFITPSNSVSFKVLCKKGQRARKGKCVKKS